MQAAATRGLIGRSVDKLIQSQSELSVSYYGATAHSTTLSEDMMAFLRTEVSRLAVRFHRLCSFTPQREHREKADALSTHASFTLLPFSISQRLQE